VIVETPSDYKGCSLSRKERRKLSRPVSAINFFPGRPLDHRFQGVTFWASYVFFNAVFPKLAHDLLESRQAREEFLNGSIKEDEFERRFSMARSKIMNISYFWNNMGQIIEETRPSLQ
jgi:hypothetical protein